MRAHPLVRVRLTRYTKRISRPRIRCTSRTYARTCVLLLVAVIGGLCTCITRIISHTTRNIGPIEFLRERAESLQWIRCLDRAIASSFRRYFPTHVGSLPEFITRTPQTAFLRIRRRRRRLQIQRRESEFVDRRPISRTLLGFKSGRRSSPIYLSI